ncbi:hypothetical protein BU26DRAFT_507057 [Trematosphaeria pertusa]|uniref:Uncharacterized protein n=1 Tax=Trematosphaeria pertusa TaxID=390896 RepID=A0A6A6I844_9PLEO|nr:uncharacterized protein BU26DRAFT_507057 [Trematosphaeria pertusa]KAF2246457.1 hypothetical protein BU26DRAFT_507057 [Trematosphaeria pertusa]
MSFDWRRMSLWVLPHFGCPSVTREAAIAYYGGGVMPANRIGYAVHRLQAAGVSYGGQPAPPPHACGVYPPSHGIYIPFPLPGTLFSAGMSDKGYALLAENFRALGKVRLEEGFRLCVHISRFVDGERGLGRVLRVLWPMCVLLKEKGVEVEILVLEEGKFGK